MLLCSRGSSLGLCPPGLSLQPHPQTPSWSPLSPSRHPPAKPLTHGDGRNLQVFIEKAGVVHLSLRDQEAQSRHGAAPSDAGSGLPPGSPRPRLSGRGRPLGRAVDTPRPGAPCPPPRRQPGTPPWGRPGLPPPPRRSSPSCGAGRTRRASPATPGGRGDGRRRGTEPTPPAGGTRVSAHCPHRHPHHPSRQSPHRRLTGSPSHTALAAAIAVQG